MKGKLLVTLPDITSPVEEVAPPEETPVEEVEPVFKKFKKRKAASK